MVFFKPVKNADGSYEFLFQLANIEVKEDYALWDNANRRFLRGSDVDSTKFMKAIDFQQKYPNLRKNTQYQRDIIVHENNAMFLYQFGFKKTANDDLNKAIQNNLNLNIDVRELLFKLRKIGNGIDTTYAVSVMQKVGLPTNVQIPQFVTQQQADRQFSITPLQTLKIEPILSPQMPSVSGMTLEKPSTSKMQLSEQEKHILDLINNDKEYYSEDYFVEVFNMTLSKWKGHLLMPERLKQIYNEHYVRKS